MRTLLVDLDPQASATDFFGLYEEATDAGTVELLYGEKGVEACAHPTRFDNLSCVPATLSLVDQNELLLGEQTLRFALDDAEGAYDAVVLDCAPSAKRLMLAALVAASGRGTVVVPVKLDSTVMRGTASTVAAVRGVSTRLRLPEPNWRILRTMVPGRITNAERVGAAVLDRYFPNRQFATVIHHSSKVMEGSWEWKPIVEFMPANRAAADYRALGEEMKLWDE